MIKYHDEEWGKPVHDDKTLFEFLILEGAQAGLNWQTVLNKRENYRKAFSGFDPAKVACYTTFPCQCGVWKLNPSPIASRYQRTCSPTFMVIIGPLPYR